MFHIGKKFNCTGWSIFWKFLWRYIIQQSRIRVLWRWKSAIFSNDRTKGNNKIKWFRYDLCTNFFNRKFYHLIWTWISIVVCLWGHLSVLGKHFLCRTIVCQLDHLISMCDQVFPKHILDMFFLFGLGFCRGQRSHQTTSFERSKKG